jgi:hypothetical protein
MAALDGHECPVGDVVGRGAWRGQRRLGGERSPQPEVCGRPTASQPDGIVATLCFMAGRTEQAVTGGQVIDPGPGRRTNTIGHPVERMLNASARDILDALENGFRARADLKGKLAELFMSRYLDELERSGEVDHYEWFDEDGVPDFTIWLTSQRVVTLEVKNVRSGRGSLRVETQKTRPSRRDRMSRYYRVDQFDILAACLYNRTGRWEYVFVRTADLRRLASDQRYLEPMQAVPTPVSAPWHEHLADLLP